MTKETVFVTGGAGFIGSMVNLALHDAGYQTIVLDNLSSGDARAVIHGELIRGDLGDQALLDSLFKKYPISVVMHFAALTDVGESVQNPALYYHNNVLGTLVLLDAMLKAGIQKLIFSSSAAVYGIPAEEKVLESSICNPINPYGETKWMIERILRDYDKAYGLASCSLRYFNAAGGDPSGRLKHYKEKENNLIPIVLNAIINQTAVTINGTDYETRDGTCIRDYIHVADLAEAHLLAMQKILNGNPSCCYNLGNGNGFTVREVIYAAEQVTRQRILAQPGPRRPGDPPVLLACAEKAEKELGWRPRYPELNTMIQHAWNARQNAESS
jgi:UDP-glucose 4-epimerase